MKLSKIIAILFVALTIARVMTEPLIYADFEMRREYIAEVLCINQDRPELLCAGKCYLKNQLSQFSDSQNSDNQSFKKEYKDFYLYFFPLPIKYIAVAQADLLVAIPFDLMLEQDYQASLFRPPIS